MNTISTNTTATDITITTITATENIAAVMKQIKTMSLAVIHIEIII